MNPERFCRQLMLKEIGREGQRRISSARILVVGAGGLGCPASIYLVAMGVGALTIVDDDQVAVSNLHRQILYGERDLGLQKVEVATRKLADLSGLSRISGVEKRLSVANALEFIDTHDIILDCSDNFYTRYLVSDAAVMARKTLVSAAVSGFSIQLAVYGGPAGKPCYRCVFPNVSDLDSIRNCTEGGVLGSVAGIAGIMQAQEAIKIIVRKETSTASEMICLNTLDWELTKTKLAPRSDCPGCRLATSENRHMPWPLPLPELRSCSRPGREISLQELEKLKADGVKVCLIDVREPEEFQSRHLAGAINLPSPGFTPDHPMLLSSDRLVFVCQSGQRSAQCLDMLPRELMERSLHLEGGMASIDYFADQLYKSPDHQRPEW